MFKDINHKKAISQPYLWAFFLLVLIFFFKRPESILNAQFYAEDATIFFKDAMNGTFLETISTRYAGYYWTIHRLFAGLFSFFNIGYQPLFYNLFALVTNSLILAFFATKYFRQIVDNDVHRIIISLLLSLMYLDSYEMVNVFINTKWYMTIFLFLFLVADENIITSKSQKIFFATIIILIFWTQPQAFYLLPLFIIKYFLCKEKIFYSIIIGLSIFHPILIFMNGGMPSSHLEGGTLSYYGVILGLTLKSNLYFLFGSFMSKSLVIFIILSIVLYMTIYKLSKDLLSKYFIFSYFYVAVSVIFTLIKKKEVTIALANHGLGITPYYFLLVNTLTLLVSLIIIRAYWNKNIYMKILSSIFMLLLLICNVRAFKVQEFEDKHWIKSAYNASICKKSIIQVNPSGWSFEYFNDDPDYELFSKMITKKENVTEENYSFSMHPFPEKNVNLSFTIPSCLSKIELKLYIKQLPLVVENSELNNIGSVKVSIYKFGEPIYSNIINTLTKNEIITFDKFGEYNIVVDANGSNTYDWFYIDVVNIK